MRQAKIFVLIAFAIATSSVLFFNCAKPVDPSAFSVNASSSGPMSNASISIVVTQTPLDVSQAQSTSAEFTVDDSTNGAYQVTCSVDGADAATCVSPVILNGLAVGTHTLTIVATDRADSSLSSTQSVSWKVATVAPACTTGTKIYNVPGTYTFTVPAFCNSLAVKVWGGGGGGASGYSAGENSGGPGGTSSFNGSVVASGGGGGPGIPNSPIGVNACPPSANGGAGSGGSTNAAGSAGGSCKLPLSGGNAAGGGGAGGYSPNGLGVNGSAPGGGGTGSAVAIAGDGGGGGGYSAVNYPTTQFLPGSQVSVIVGAGGAGGAANFSSNGLNDKGGDGAPGQVIISW